LARQETAMGSRTVAAKTQFVSGGHGDLKILRAESLMHFYKHIKGFIKGFEERHCHGKPPSAPAEEGNIGMMRLLGVGPIDIISTTIMTTTLNGSLPASSDCIAPSQQPALCRCWPPTQAASRSDGRPTDEGVLPECGGGLDHFVAAKCAAWMYRMRRSSTFGMNDRLGGYERLRWVERSTKSGGPRSRSRA